MVSSFSGPWVVIGDLNCIKQAKEKHGGCVVAKSSISHLRDFMSNTGTIDLGFTSPSFTWSNKKEGLANIKEKLDQYICDQEWQSLFPKVGVRHLCNSNSDHNSILLDTILEPDVLSWPFRFEAMWTREEESRSVVENAWKIWVEGSQGSKLVKKLSVTCREIKHWNKSTFGDSKEKNKGLKGKIAKMQQATPQERTWN